MLPPCLQRALCVATVSLIGCGPAPPLHVPSAPRVTLPDEPPPPTPEPPPTRPAPAVGAATGLALASITVPVIEDGVRGSLQALPTLRTTSLTRLKSTWMSIKRDANLQAQHKRVHQQVTRPSGATALIDLWAFEGAGLPPFGRRDRVRGRTWVTRTMAAVLITAWERFHAAHPAATLTMGDLAQPWGGNIIHNTLVHKVSGQEAINMLDIARLRGGRWVAEVSLKAADFQGEIGRFDSPEDRVWVRHELSAQLAGGGPPGLRASTIRYTFPHTPTEEERQSAFGTAASIAKRGTRVTSERVRHVDDEGHVVDRWRDHWVDSEKKRQLVTFSRKAQGKRLRMSWVDVARVANWQQRKPGSFPREYRWVRSPRDAQGNTTWTRWQAMREAGHVSHMTGSDADISFVTSRNTRHFAVDLNVFDARLTWAWLEALEAAAADLRTSIDVVLISRPIIRALERQLSRKQKQSALWRKRIRRAPGHDAHHHLRLEAPSQDSDARARAVLQSLTGP
jgi:hypothetical protein